MAREGENANANGRRERSMEEGAAGNGREEGVNPDHGYASSADKGCGLSLSIPFLQKVRILLHMALFEFLCLLPHLSRFHCCSCSLMD